ncbi:porin [Bradyrhizobium sp. CCBAU 051011]|jgi:Porin subfamily|uniref:porin n=1 Tax=Bradyrhizobium sp. CCBAU 051011 TaxID=858422 RepID=UPI0013742C80|nr:porin [Bradyrhizobium sp. CCBAU 051011]QHO77238.1 porin [Bradyrhizobium sp. CCBAU 051011]
MKMVKSLILGSAAALVAMGGAQAADLPVKAKAVEYVRICSLYGAGFWYIPGTDTCIKLGGYLRVDTTFNGGIYGQPFYNGDNGQGNRYRDYFNSRSRMALTVDTRTATEYGVVRTFGQADFQFQNFGSSNPGLAVGSQSGGLNSALLSTAGGGYVAVEMVFIQFAGFTFGKSASAYATPWNGYPGNNNSFLMGGPDYVTGVNNIQYTAQFGNGVSATIGLDDPTVFSRTVVGNLSVGLPATGSGVPANAYGGIQAPDIVGNIRVDQAWGLFQISGALHNVNASYNVLTAATAAPNNLSEISGHPDSKWGGAVTAALQIKNLPTGAGDDFKIDATYSKGMTKAVISTSGGTPQFLMFGGSSFPGAYQSFGFGVSTDAIYSGGFGGGATQGLILTNAWGVRGAFNHNWDPYWSTSLWGSYAAVRYDGDTLDPFSAAGAYCAAFTAATGGLATKSADYSCNPDFNIAQVGLITRWTPVKNLTFSAEVGAFFLDQKFTGASFIAAAPAPKPAAVYEFRDQSTVFLNVRAQRNF